MQKPVSPNPRSFIIAGSSAGCAGTAMLAEDIVELFPSAKKVTLVCDSMLINTPRWKKVFSEVWQSPKHIVERLRSDNFMLENLAHLKAKYSERVRILYLCSVRDALLIMAQNAIDGNGQVTREGDGEAFQRRLKVMCDDLMREIPDVGIYIFNAPMDAEGYDPSLTLHCTLNNPSVFDHREDGISPAEWIMTCAGGNIRNVGIKKLCEQ